jgi:hypothetical protein
MVSHLIKKGKVLIKQPYPFTIKYRITSYELRVTSYELRVSNYEFRVTVLPAFSSDFFQSPLSRFYVNA